MGPGRGDAEEEGDGHAGDELDLHAGEWTVLGGSWSYEHHPNAETVSETRMVMRVTLGPVLQLLWLVKGFDDILCPIRGLG